MASGQQLSAAMHNLLQSLTERGIKVPTSAQTPGQLRKLDRMDRSGKASGQEFITEVLARRKGGDKVGEIRKDRPDSQDFTNEQNYRDRSSPSDDDIIQRLQERIESGKSDPTAQTDLEKLTDDPAHIAMRDEISSRTKAPARPPGPTQFKRSSPETERKQVAYRQSPERKAMREDGDPYKVSETNYADDVPNIEDDPRHIDQKQGVDDIEEAIRLLTGGKLAGGAKDMATLLALRQQERGNMSGLVREQRMEGQRFSDLQPGRRNQSVGSSEGSAIDNQAALDQQAMAEYFNSMRNN